jgi:hypothetical protein
VINTEVHGVSHLMDLFILPRRSVFNENKARRAVESSMSIISQHWQAKDYRQVNKTSKTSFYYMVVYDDEWFDSRLISELRAALIYSREIQMFVVFIAEGAKQVIFQPRIFSSDLKLDPDERQPLPFNHNSLNFEKLIGGWLYVD